MAFRCSCAWSVRTGKRRSPQGGYAGEGTYGGMCRFVIDMDERSLDTGKYLNRVLKFLANIVCFPQRCACIHDDVDLNEVVWAALTCGNPVRKVSTKFQIGQ